MLIWAKVCISFTLCSCNTVGQMHLVQEGEVCINIPIFGFILNNLSMLFTLVAQSP